MRRGSGIFLFAFFFVLAVGFQYSEYLKPGKSLFLSYFYDPTPRLSFYPWLVESTRQLHHGHFPLWCNLEGAGMPLLANYQTTPFHPFNLLFEIFPSLRLLDYILLLRLALLGIFSYLFAIELGLSPLASASSALTICFCGYVSRNINHLFLNTEVWVPAALLIVERVLKSGSGFLKFLLLGLVSCLALIGGNPETAFYFFVFVVLYALFRAGPLWKRVFSLIVPGLALGFILSPVQLLSFSEYLGFAWNFHDPSIHSADFAPLRGFHSLFFPWLSGNAQSGPQMRLMPGYLGMVPALLCLLTILKIKELPRAGLFFWIWALVFLAIVFRLPPFSYLNHLPVMDQVRSARCAYFGVCFSIAMLAGTGLDKYLKGQLSLRDCLAALALTSGLAILAMALALFFPTDPSLHIIDHGQWLWPATIFLFAAGVCLAGILSTKKMSAAIALAALSLVNLLFLARGLAPLVDIQPEIWSYKNPSPPPILAPIINDKSLVRFLGAPGVFTENVNMIFGINDLRVYEALYPKGYVQAMAEIEGFRMEDSVEQFIKFGWSFNVREENLTHPLLDEMGVKYLLTAHEINASGWTPVSRIRDHFLYMNQEAWSRVWLNQGSPKPDFDSVRVVEYLPDKVSIKINNPRASELVMADQYAPGWRAFARPVKREIRILKQNILFRKVDLKPGDEKIVFIYQPRGFQIGLFATLASVLSLLIMTGVWIIQSQGRAAAGTKKGHGLG